MVLLLLATSLLVTAQNLPNVQKESLRAPANIKVDGRATEWGNRFQAYNKTTQIFYTIANDDNNLYLTVQATEPVIIQKIITHGMVFSVNNSNKDIKPLSVTFPILTNADYGRIITNLNTDPARNLTDSSAIRKRNDSLVYAMNNQLTSKLKEIGVENIPGITDTRISVYNETGIKAITFFENKKTLTCEFAIPVKLLAQTEKLNYTIKLNGSISDRENNVTTEVNGGYIRRSSPGSMTVEIKATPHALALLAIGDPTEFSGEYTLAKK